MGWKETGVEKQRLELAREYAAGERTRAEICRRFGVSRKTGYKWYREYLEHGEAGLGDRSRAPRRQARAIDEATIGAVIALRARYPTWGERKLKAVLEREHPERRWPSSGAIGAILQRYGLTHPPQRRRKAPRASAAAAPTAVNQEWAIDYKGWFRTGDGRRCEPLTLSDTHTRFLLRCQAVERTGRAHIQPLLEAAFREYGLPQRIRSDNGAPFASRGVGGLSRLSVWWIRLGVLPQRIEPGRPDQNGRHERLHRTLKRDTATPPAASWEAQQRRFDEFRRVYNEERPHEALQMATPASLYQASPREFPERLSELVYPAGYVLRRVQPHGDLEWAQGRLFLGEALAGETVGFEEAADGWRIWFGPLPLAWLDARQLSANKARRDARGRGRWRLDFLDGSGRPTGSRRRPKNPIRKRSPK